MSPSSRKNKMPTSFLSRSVKLAGMAGKIAMKEAGSRLLEGFKKLDEMSPETVKLRIEQAKILTENLSQLKGAAQKAGQLLSINAGDFLPPEALQILSQLQGDGASMPFEDVQKILLAELGEEKLARFKNLSAKPIASASIGQVHKANLENEEVAIKIQYPAIATSIDSDLALLRRLLESILPLTGKRMDLKGVFAELAEVLHQESDYLAERSHLEEFRRLLLPYAEYVVPKTYPDLSTARVLTMSWEEGLPLSKWLALRPSMQDREKVGDLILDLYCKEFFEWGFVQTDPNFANYLITPSPLRLVCLDFGASLRYSPEFKSAYIKLLRLIDMGPKKDLLEHAIQFGFVSGRENEKTLDLFVTMLEVSMEPFLESSQPFRFANKNYLEKSRLAIQNFSYSLKYSLPPKQLLFLHRKLGGIFQLMKQMEIEKDLRPVWRRMVTDNAER